MHHHHTWRGTQHLAHALIAFCIGGELADFAGGKFNYSLAVLLQLDRLLGGLYLL
jgi:hypothetical protein